MSRPKALTASAARHGAKPVTPWVFVERTERPPESAFYDENLSLLSYTCRAIKV